MADLGPKTSFKALNSPCFLCHVLANMSTAFTSCGFQITFLRSNCSWLRFANLSPKKSYLSFVTNFFLERSYRTTNAKKCDALKGNEMAAFHMEEENFYLAKPNASYFLRFHINWTRPKGHIHFKSMSRWNNYDED